MADGVGWMGFGLGPDHCAALSRLGFPMGVCVCVSKTSSLDKAGLGRVPV